MTTLMDGISRQTVETDRIRANVLFRRASEEENPTPVVFIHGNVSSSLFFQPTMLGLDHDSFAIDLRGFGDSETLPVDATRGLRDFADDVAGVLDALGVARAHLVGWSMGGGVIAQVAIDRPDLAETLTLIAPVPPFGFGTAVSGGLLTDDAAGTGGIGVNGDFVAAISAGDTSEDGESSPRSVFRSSYVAPGHLDGHEDLWVQSMLSTAVTDDNYPGDGVESANWPGFAAGTRGVLNAMSGKWLNWSPLADQPKQPRILWVRGAVDAIVGDESLFDFNTLGKIGAVPGWPGVSVAPPTPMITQTRAVLERCQDAREVVFEGVGHSPHLERPDAFLRVLREHIRA